MKEDGAVKLRTGMKFVVELPKGSDWRVLPNGSIIVVHPDHEPYIISSDGSRETPEMVEMVEAGDVLLAGLPKLGSKE